MQGGSTYRLQAFVSQDMEGLVVFLPMNGLFQIAFFTDQDLSLQIEAVLDLPRLRGMNESNSILVDVSNRQHDSELRPFAFLGVQGDPSTCLGHNMIGYA